MRWLKERKENANAKRPSLSGLSCCCASTRPLRHFVSIPEASLCKHVKYCMDFAFWLASEKRRQSAACAIVESILIIKYAVSLALTLAAELLARNVVRYAMKEDGL